MISFDNVFFSYPQRADAMILRGVTLSIPPGKTVALCGGSGNGKSTIIQLLQRMYEVRRHFIQQCPFFLN